jgi:fatty acid amide hydrolase
LVGRRDQYRQRFAAAMSAAGVQVLICPPCSVPAFRHGTTQQLGPASVSYTCLYNLLAYPAGVVSTATVREDGRLRLLWTE